MATRMGVMVLLFAGCLAAQAFAQEQGKYPPWPDPKWETAKPGGCYRSGISYNAVLKCYLWCQILPGPDTRFEGRFGIYDAPEPWGPWTTAFYTEHWDVGPGETSSIPTKWISEDGWTIHLVFSGDDHFSVRQARLVIAP